MPMLDTILKRKIRLIDYEKICDNEGRRLVMFGKWAGYAGFLDILHGLGQRLKLLGHKNPFERIVMAHDYFDSKEAVKALKECGEEINSGALPTSLGPMIFVFTGTGNVSQGSRELFKHLPHEYVEPDRLPEIAKNGDMNKIYGCIVSRKHHLRRKIDGRFDPTEFEAFPERYESNFITEIAPYASVIINGLFWRANDPRLIKTLDSTKLSSKLIAICDISADPNGSIEFMTECTTIEKPFVIYNPEMGTTTSRLTDPGILICSIDNMPTQLPREATEHFGNLLLPFVEDMLKAAQATSFNKIKCVDEIKNAIITSNGHLTKKYDYIHELMVKQLERKINTRAEETYFDDFIDVTQEIECKNQKFSKSFDSAGLLKITSQKKFLTQHNRA
uniref:Alanine dehydrogenase/pyridine nucleotide transhydrogenase NAD(H)-binding domain-containing protein n=1 Tax=Acrobeloides nanus TaxID=290746 RepID=A0A914D3V8_9BILA